MTTVLSQKGQIVLPNAVREQLHLEPGQDFEVFIDNEDTITLRRINRPPNHGLVDHLLACPTHSRFLHGPKIPPGRIRSFNASTAHVWGQLVAAWDKNGTTIPSLDSQLAATAHRHNLTMVTRNVSDFQNTGVKLFNPSEL